MMSYKLLKDGIIIDAVDAPVFVYYNQRLGLFLACDEVKAQGIASRDGTTYYHLSDKEDFCVDGYDTIDAEVISFEDAKLIMDAIDAGRPLPEPPAEEPEEEPEEDVVTDGSLNLVRAYKQSEMSDACEQAIYSGTNIELQDGIHHFTFTLQDQSNLALLGMNIIEYADKIPYHADGEPYKYYSEAEFRKIVMGLNDWRLAHSIYLRQLWEYIESLTTLKELSSVTYGMELPEEYQSSVLKGD